MGGRIRPRDLNPRVSPDEPTLVSPPCMTGARTISETTLKTARLVTKTVLFSTLVVAVVGSTLAIAQRDDFAFFDPLMDVKGAIDRFYLEEPDQKALQTGAIEGMIATLNDPYTVFVPARERREFDKELTGEYVGIGAQIQIRDGWLTIASPLEDSPAYRVGLMADDKVVKINGESTFGLTDEQCVEKLTGEPGTTVTLTIERKGEELELTIKREPIKTRSVKGFHRDPTDAQKWQSYIDPARKIVYLRLTQFTPNCSLEVAEALRQAGADKGDVKGLILDVRWNGGGVLQDAIAIADMFLNDGVIVSTKGRSHPEEVARAEAPGTLPDFPIAVLVNAQSASASEVLAGALAENGRAVVVGTRTFGKGLVQTVRTLPNAGGAQLKITEQAYYLPSGRSLHRKGDSAEWGVDPTDGFFIPITDDEVFEIFTIRREQDIIRGGASEGESDWSDPDKILEKLKDRQMAAALRAIQAKIDTGEWLKTGGPLPGRGEQAGEELARLLLTRERVERELVRMDERIESLQTASGKVAELADLWDDEIDPTGGRVVVYDKDGKPISELTVTGPNLERALQLADVAKPATVPEAGAGADASNKPEPKSDE